MLAFDQKKKKNTTYNKYILCLLYTIFHSKKCKNQFQGFNYFADLYTGF